MVVLWGAAQHDVPDEDEFDGIEFVAGRRFVRWLNELEGQQVSKEAAADVLQRLSEFRATAWDRGRQSRR